MIADRLVWLLKRFELRASVFQAGPLSCAAQAPEAASAGYLHLLQTGSVRVVSGAGPDIEIHEPSAFFYMNPTQHRLEPLSDDVSIVCATFEFGIGEGNPLQAALPELCIVSLRESPELGDTLGQLFREAGGEHCGRDSILDRLSEVALILILRDLMDQRRLDIGLLAGLADPKLSRAINAIHARPEEDWTLERMAEVAAMSRARFAQRFHDVVGMTPGAYLSDWRLGLAKSMLLKGATVQTIAADVGYGSASALSRVFSSRLGMSPTEWRRSSQL
ncbi:MAG: AraC family transcriptional regulator [Woeseiaceae bacterium]|nr:AraC family transcriptional regulator [Woeseiaceae bacterium]